MRRAHHLPCCVLYVLPLQVKTVVANPLAFERHQRFVDDDLNRQFAVSDLAAGGPRCCSSSSGGIDSTASSSSGSSGSSNTDSSYVDSSAESPLAYEASRAQELASLLGPKSESNEPSADFIIDLHTTTTNMVRTASVRAG